MSDKSLPADPPADTATEAVAGFTTFLTMAYIVVVNPSILSAAGMPFDGVLAATVLLSASMTLLMGLYARLPFAVAPGMGLNAFFAYTLVLGQKVPWPTALGLVFWAGVLFLIISLTPLRAMIAEAIPAGLRHAAAVGIGVFIAFIGLKNAGLIAANPATLVSAGAVRTPMLLAAGGVAVILLVHRWYKPVAFLAGIAAVTGAAAAMGLIRTPDSCVKAPDFSLIGALDLRDSLRPELLGALFIICLTDLFDSISTFVGVSQATGLTDGRGRPRNLEQGLLVDAAATFGAGLLGTSSGTAYIESAAGIEAGGRTGLTSVFTAACFLPLLFLSPLAAMVPAYATAPVLVIVGVLMFRSVSAMDFARLEDAVPQFLTLTLIPLTFSITQGLLWGFLAHVVLYVLVGRVREVHPLMFGLAAVSAGLLWLENGHRGG